MVFQPTTTTATWTAVNTHGSGKKKGTNQREGKWIRLDPRETRPDYVLGWGKKVGRRRRREARFHFTSFSRNHCLRGLRQQTSRRERDGRLKNQAAPRCQRCQTGVKGGRRGGESGKVEK